MSEKRFILEMQAAYNQFTKAEKKVADYVINNQQKVLYMSITDLADACHVGDTSVYRFCRTMKLQGYQDFKMKLSLSMASPEEENHDKSQTNDLAERVMNLTIGAIRETYTLLDREKVNQALELLSKAERVYFFGIGDSLITAQSACNKFLRITNKATCLADHGRIPGHRAGFASDCLLVRRHQGQYSCGKAGQEGGGKGDLCFPFQEISPDGIRGYYASVRCRGGAFGRRFSGRENRADLPDGFAVSGILQSKLQGMPEQ